MTRRFLFLILSCWMFAATAATPPVGLTYSCVPFKVWDGDTFDAQCKKIGIVRVRYYQSDAPEKSQPWGTQSRKWLEQTVKDKTVRVKVIAVEASTNVHQQRWIAEIRVGVGGHTVNRMAVEQGMAWASPGFTKPNSILRNTQRDAQKAGIGLWSLPNPIAPWDWRHGRRS